jgi:hypothetical protein
MGRNTFCVRLDSFDAIPNEVGPVISVEVFFSRDKNPRSTRVTVDDSNSFEIRSKVAK